MDTLKVSVVIPAFNAEKWIEQCLRSVKNQTLTPLELLVVNDGSTDRTQEIAEKHADRCMHRVVNRGIGYTRHDGTEFANGDYVAFLSADDAYHPYFLELMMREADGRSILFSDYWRCNEHLHPTNVFMAPHFRTQHEFRKLVIGWTLRQSMFTNFSTVIIPKCVFNQVQFDETLRYGEDGVFLLETVLAQIPWRHVSLPLVYYRVHREAGTKKGWDPTYRFQLWERLLVLLRELGVEREVVHRAFDKAMHDAVRKQRKRMIPEPVKVAFRKLREMTM